MEAAPWPWANLRCACTFGLLGTSGGERSLSGLSLAAGDTVAAAAAPEPPPPPPLRVPAPPPDGVTPAGDDPEPAAFALVLAAAAEPTFRRRLPSFDTTILIFSLLPRHCHRQQQKQIACQPPPSRELMTIFWHNFTPRNGTLRAPPWRHSVPARWGHILLLVWWPESHDFNTKFITFC